MEILWQNWPAPSGNNAEETVFSVPFLTIPGLFKQPTSTPELAFFTRLALCSLMVQSVGLKLPVNVRMKDVVKSSKGCKSYATLSSRPPSSEARGGLVTRDQRDWLGAKQRLKSLFNIFSLNATIVCRLSLLNLSRHALHTWQ